MSNQNLSLIIRCPGRKPVRLRPGQRLRIGRHESNDIVLNDGTVSRFHAELVWDPDEDRPFVRDNNSANGVDVDGVPVEERAYIPGGNRLTVGDFTLAVEIRTEAPKQTGASDFLTEDDDEAVTLFSDRGGDLDGQAEAAGIVQRLALSLEEDRRTGTLVLDGEAERYEVVFSQGKIVTAAGGGKSAPPGADEPEAVSGKKALRRALRMASCAYRFTKAVTPSETEFLNVSPESFLKLDLRIDTEVLRKSGL